MRLAISNPRRGWGGAATMTVELARGLTARGHHVVVLCRRDSPLARALAGDVPLEPVLRSVRAPPRSILNASLALRRHRIDAVIRSTAKDRRISLPAARLTGALGVARWLAAIPIGTRLQGWSALGRAGARRIRERFDRSAMLDAYESLLSRLVGAARHRGAVTPAISVAGPATNR